MPPSSGNWQEFLKQLEGLKAGSAFRKELADSPQNLFFNRELSWLDFNDRVLAEALDPSVPLLERLRFACIVSSNLDEFFMIRVAEVSELAQKEPEKQYQDGLTAAQVYNNLRERVLDQKARQAQAFHHLVELLGQHGIRLYTDFRQQEAEIEEQLRLCFPEVKVQMRQIGDPIPNLPAGRLHVFVRFVREFAILTIEKREERLLELPPRDQELRFAFLERWLAARASVLFSGREVIEAFPFKIIREATLSYDKESEDTLEAKIMNALERRIKGRVVRLEVDAPSYSEGAFLLAQALGLDSASLYRFNLPLDLSVLFAVYKKGPAELRYGAVQPVVVPPLKDSTHIFSVLRHHDIVLHHPYDAFDIVVNFLEQAAKDSKVTQIFHTIYRTGRESPIVRVLKEAAEKGKKVSAYVEIKARFDELTNLNWAADLRNCGVKVLPALGRLKVHTKATLVLRREEGADVAYVHLGTGNYHSATARQYTDLGILTRDTAIGEEMMEFFAALERRETPGGFKEILVAPKELPRRILALIEREVEIQKAGGEGRVIAKMNSLVDPDIINALYQASQAGVRVDLIVRGICCLRPQVKGLSENIRVTSIIDRFLEHSRIYYFGGGGDEKIYFSSADWMPRNFYGRFEIAFPVKDAKLKRYVRDVILEYSLQDNVKAWTLQGDGAYIRSQRKDGEEDRRSQFRFETLAWNHYKGTVLEYRIPLDK